MYPLFVFPYLRTLQAVFSETMRFYAGPGPASALIDAPFRFKHSSFCSRRLGVSGPPLPENLWWDFSIDFLFKFAVKTAIFGRSLAQLILATLLLYPLGQKGPSLTMYPLVGFCLFTHQGPPGLDSSILELPGVDLGFLFLLEGVCLPVGDQGRASARVTWILAVKRNEFIDFNTAQCQHLVDMFCSLPTTIVEFERLHKNSCHDSSRPSPHKYEI